MLPDNDGVPNIRPQYNFADDDGADDAVQTVVNLPHCQLTEFDFDRDGDWADSLTCIDPGTGLPVDLTERAVENFEFTESLGAHTVTTPSFRAYDPAPGGNIWMRITLTPSTITSRDGRGLLYHYTYAEGETEDFYLEYSGGSEYSP